MRTIWSLKERVPPMMASTSFRHSRGVTFLGVSNTCAGEEEEEHDEQGGERTASSAMLGGEKKEEERFTKGASEQRNTMDVRICLLGCWRDLPTRA